MKGYKNCRFCGGQGCLACDSERERDETQHKEPCNPITTERNFKMEYFEVPRPDGDGYCSDNSCPCEEPGTRIPRGSGYLYIPKEVVDFRRDARTVQDVKRKLARIKEQMGITFIFMGGGGYIPILVCEQGAKKRELDLEVAAADAKYWWETGLVPLRPTPMLVLNSRQFEGHTVEEAKAAATSAIPLEKVHDIKVTREVQEQSVEGNGKSADAAIETAQARVLKGAFEVGHGEITQEGQQGMLEVQAYSEEEVRRAWKDDVPAEASFENLECIITPKKGFLGIGKKSGLWKVHWSTPFKAKVFFKLPALVTVQYKEYGLPT